MTLKEYGYCIHLATGKDLGDMCEACCDEREKMLDYRVWSALFRLPFGLGYKLHRLWHR